MNRGPAGGSTPPPSGRGRAADSAAGLQRLLRNPAIWRGGDFRTLQNRDQNHLSTGFASLDAQLPGGGWAPGMLVEILLPRPGVGELQMLLPSLVECSRRGQWSLWVSPPWIPYAPALANAGMDLSQLLVAKPDSGTEALWAAEQALRDAACGVVLLWSKKLPQQALKRLQLAAEAGGSHAFLFRPDVVQTQSSPAPVRLLLEPSGQGLGLRILKCRGRGPAAASFTLHTDN